MITSCVLLMVFELEYWSVAIELTQLGCYFLPDTSTSSDEEEAGSKPSEIEFRILQKEFNACNEQCDILKERNRVSLVNLFLNFPCSELFDFFFICDFSLKKLRRED